MWSRVIFETENAIETRMPQQHNNYSLLCHTSQILFRLDTPKIDGVSAILMSRSPDEHVKLTFVL